MQFLRLGSNGLDVRRVQQALNGRMLPPNNPFSSPALKRLDEDGIFGPKTQAMVREFQRLNQIAVDGIVGPDTSYLLFPYLSFTGQLAGQGRVIGKKAQVGLKPLGGRFLANPGLFASPVGGGASKTKDPASVGDDDKEKDGLTFDLSVDQGTKTEFKPWFVLKPDAPPDGTKASSTVTVSATVLRFKGIEFGGEFEFSRPLSGEGGDTWKYEGAIKGTYKAPKLELGILSISPIAEVSVKQGLVLGASVGAEASLKLIPGKLELSAGGKVAGEWDTRNGSVKAGPELSGPKALFFNLTVTAP